MKILDFFNQRSRKLSIIDWKLAQGAAMCIALIIAKLYPAVIQISGWWLVAVAAVLYIKPLYVFYIKS